MKVKAIPLAKPAFGTRFAVEQAMLAALQDLGRDAKADFDKTVATWNDKPGFDVKADLKGVSITTGDENYQRVDKGTRAHIIVPHGSYPLRFKVGGRAKTRPGVIGSSGGSKGNEWVSSDRVKHPGTRARKFSETISKKYQGKVNTYFKKMLRVAVNQT